MKYFMMLENNKITNIKTLKTGKWLTFKEIEYYDKNGQQHYWETVNRKNDNGAVTIIPIFKQSRDILFIKQYRAPAEAYLYEFPAGLIDFDATPESTALRELYEETGYTGKITRMLPPCFNTPGLSSETTHIAFVEIDEELPGNQNPTPMPEYTEDITTERIAVDQLSEFLIQNKSTVKIDSKICCFALGVSYSHEQ